MTEVFIVLGVVVLSFALRSTRLRLVRKLGSLGILAATFLFFYYLTDSIAAVGAGLGVCIDVLEHVAHVSSRAASRSRT